MLNDDALDLIFRKARTHNAWRDRSVTDDDIRRIYELVKWGPTSANMCPARFVFVRSREAKERLAPALSSGNLEKTMAAPATAVIGYDVKFFERMDYLFPHNAAMADFYRNGPEAAEDAGFRNGTLQGAYFMIAARALGFDIGAISGFDKDTATAASLPGT
ncbi:MAG: malonic semialdehyde reductase, partial [Alphaproteobacteria bacterium]|nr:malonic semialdehyde reductase [Alphaproteobacteria bacterium]